MSVKKVIRYWRESLLDDDLSTIQLSPDNHIRIPMHQLNDGILDDETTRSLFSKMSWWPADEDSEVDTENRVESIPVVIAPIVAVKKRSWAYGSRKNILPILIPALLSHKGYLEVYTNNGDPWIPRILLEPTASNLVLGSFDDFTSFLDSNKPEIVDDSRKSWKKLEEFSREMLDTVAGPQWETTFENADYRIEKKAALLPISLMRGMSANIIKVYDELRETGNYPPLLIKYVQLNSPPSQSPLTEEAWDRPSKLHLGSFSNKFPLSPSQRQALYHFLMLPEHAILAISGPPGTGKTTLLHSVIASLWVKAALEGKSPPVIVASSTNNQAVTNVIDSLSGSGDLMRSLDVPSFGLYLVNSPDKQDEAKKRGILTADNFDNGFPKEAQTKSFFMSAYYDFLAGCQNYLKQPFSNPDEAVKALQTELLSTARALEDGINHAMNCWHVQRPYTALVQEFGSFDKAIEAHEQRLVQLVAELARWQGIAKLWKTTQMEGFGLLSWLKFLPNVKRKERERRQAFVLDNLPELDPDLGGKDITDYINGEVASVQVQVERLNSDIAKIKQLSHDRDRAQKKWLDWCQQNNATQLKVDQLFVPEKSDGSANDACLNNWLDTNLRYKLFVLATHYWEGRWLQTIIEKGIIEPGYRESRNRASQEEKWRRYAMLTPCFVATMHSGPRFFNYYDGEPHPLIDYIDLLIVDEAGQVTPEVSGGMFTLARQALVVGDVLQIEPVWSIPPQVDDHNLEHFGLLSSEDERDSLYRKGLMASTGSAMQMAQSVSPYQLPAENGVSYERGMFLAEHRRCVPEVIGYCNELAYQGRLRPMRPSIKDYPWPHMGYAHVKGISSKEGGSRKNDREAQALVNWIVDNKLQLESYYSEKAKKGVNLEDIIGIVTPFAAQKRTIQFMLGKENISLSKVGTVHALQGGERPLVLFSPVYCSRDSGSYFFDQGLNMLNVAVSRAKDSFLVFGDMDIFNPLLPTPSGILARYLFSDAGNEIDGFRLPERSGADLDRDELFLINSLEKHVKTLSRAFKKAENQLIIVSPYLRRRAVQADNLAQKTAAAVSSGVKVTIYVDSYSNEHLRLPSAAEAAELLRKNGADINICYNIHSKVICIDRAIFIEGSFNWLSAERNLHHYVRHDTSLIYMGSQAENFINETIDDMETAMIS